MQLQARVDSGSHCMAHRTYSAWTFAAPNEPAKLMPADFGDDLPAGFVQVKVTHCGLCYSDIAMRDNEWGISKYPLVCGHEVVGVISAVGACAFRSSSLPLRFDQVCESIASGWSLVQSLETSNFALILLCAGMFPC